MTGAQPTLELIPSLLGFVFHFSPSPETPRPNTLKREALDHAKSLLGGAEDLANAAIVKTDCFGLFGSRSDGLTASQVLAGMESGTAYGKIQFTYNPNDTS